MQLTTTPTAPDFLLFDFDSWRVGWTEPDWLGPIGVEIWQGERCYAGGASTIAAQETISPLQPSLASYEGRDDLGDFNGVHVDWSGSPLPVRTSVRAYAEHRVLVFGLEAVAAIENLATGTFATPSVTWPWLLPARRAEHGAPVGLRTYGHQYTEFALPVSGDAEAASFLFAPHRPPVVEPLLLVAPGGRTILIAPLNHFHEQIIAVPADTDHRADGVRCGWHGDLARLPAGFATELAVWAAASPRQALDQWAGLLRRRHGTKRSSRYADPGIGRLSYWTDNGAVYYYRTEPGCDYLGTLERAIATLHEQGVPVRAAQLDSWFYPHENLRPVSPEGAPIVPPSGMMRWEPREDLFPGGFRDLQRRLAGLPLTFHSRHFSRRSPYFERLSAWTDGDYAHPSDPALFDFLMAQAASWGAITYEQDWMVESFLGVRGLREEPGRARAWQEGLDAAAAAHGLTLQWCMSTPADFMQSVSLDRLTSIRTSGDYRYMFDNGLNWVWFLHTNALARALGLNPFKDVFLSHGDIGEVKGEPYAEIESLLSALSSGPVAIGDKIGCTDRDLVLRTCREDGVLIKPDAPIAAIDRCFAANSFLEAQPLIGETYSQHPAGRWIYVASFNAWRGKKRMKVEVALADLGESRPSGPVIVFDWRRGTWQRLEADGAWECELEFQDWDYRVVCPLLARDMTIFGDVSKYATAGDHRLARIAAIEGGMQFEVLGKPQTVVEVRGWSAADIRGVSVWTTSGERSVAAGDVGGEGWTWSQASGELTLRVLVGESGWARVQLG